MELNNIEKQIKEKLQSHEIKPSEMAWDRLDAMLSVAEEKKTKRSFGWLYIAASILVLLTAGTFFFNQNTLEITPDTTIVNQEEIKDSVNDSLEKNQNEVPIEKTQPLVQVEENATEPTISNQNPTIDDQKVVSQNHKSQKSNSIVVSQKTPTINNPKTTIINQEVSIINQSSEKELTQNQQPSTYKYTSAEKLLAEVNDANFENNNSKPKEIKNTKKTVSVNPNTLLSNAESEINQYYRETTLEKLSRNFNTVKTVIANRSNR